jgi:hypothetical protein
LTPKSPSRAQNEILGAPHPIANAVRSQPINRKENIMKKFLLALSGTAVALAAAPAPLRADPPLPQVCLKWRDGVCVSTHRVKGTPSPYATGYVFGPTYSYTPYSALPQPIVTYYKLAPDGRYVYTNGYVYIVDPTTGAVTKVLDTYSH